LNSHGAHLYHPANSLQPARDFRLEKECLYAWVLSVMKRPLLAAHEPTGRALSLIAVPVVGLTGIYASAHRR
jgi:hypothetical protein